MKKIIYFLFVILLAVSITLVVLQKNNLTGFATHGLATPSGAEIDALKEKYADVLNPKITQIISKELSSMVSDSSGSYRRGYPTSNILDQNKRTYWMSNRGVGEKYLVLDLEESLYLKKVSLDLGYVSRMLPYEIKTSCLDTEEELAISLVSQVNSYKKIEIDLKNSSCKKVRLDFKYNGNYLFYNRYFYVTLDEITFTGFVEGEVDSSVEISEEGLLVYYDFNDLENPVKDLSGKENNGVVKGLVDFSKGFADIPFKSYSRSADYIDSGIVSDGNQIRTISYWVNYKDFSKSNYQISGLRHGPYLGYWRYPKAGINFRWGSGGYGNTLKVLLGNSMSPIQEGEWHMLSSTIEELNNGKFKIYGYIDGKKVNEEFYRYSGNSASVKDSSPYTFFVGAANYYGRPYMQMYGGLDEFRIYDKALSGEEVLGLFELGR